MRGLIAVSTPRLATISSPPTSRTPVARSPVITMCSTGEPVITRPPLDSRLAISALGKAPVPPWNIATP